MTYTKLYPDKSMYPDTSLDQLAFHEREALSEKNLRAMLRVRRRTPSFLGLSTLICSRAPFLDDLSSAISLSLEEGYDIYLKDAPEGEEARNQIALEKCFEHLVMLESGKAISKVRLQNDLLRDVCHVHVWKLGRTTRERLRAVTKLLRDAPLFRIHHQISGDDLERHEKRLTFTWHLDHLTKGARKMMRQIVRRENLKNAMLPVLLGSAAVFAVYAMRNT